MKKFSFLLLICLIGLCFTQPFFGEAILAKEHEYFAFTFSDTDNYTNVFFPFVLEPNDIIVKGTSKYASEAKVYLDKMPEGKRCIDIHYLSRKMTDDSETTIFWDKGCKNVENIMKSFFADLKKQGGIVDYIIDDMEIGMSNWVLKDEKLTKAIVGNPRYKTEVKPLLEERGFKFGSEEEGDLYYVSNWVADSKAYIIWNTVMGNRIADYYNSAIYYPIKESYPKVKLSNYGAVDFNGQAKLVDVNGHRLYLGGKQIKVGTHSSPVLYGNMGQISSAASRKPEDYPFEKFYLTAYNCLLKEIITAQSAYLSTPEKQLMPWIGLKTWTKDAAYKNFMNTLYYEEHVYHLAMLNPDPFLIFNVGGDDTSKDTKHLSELFTELDKITNNEKGIPLIEKETAWDQRYILSGVNLSDKSLWRITPDLYAKGVSIDSFLTSEAPVTFSISNVNIIFPENSTVQQSGYGYWVYAPISCKPEIVINDKLSAAGSPVVTDDYVPTGYQYETDVAEKKQQQNVVYKGDDKKEVPEPNSDAEAEIDNHWAQKYLEKAIELGVIKGTNKGIEPDRNVTKAEFITILCRATGIKRSNIASGFKDVSFDDWFFEDINTAVFNNWIDKNEYFYPNADITRAETAVYLSNALGITGGNSVSFSDISDYDLKTRSAIENLAGYGIIKGYPDGTFGGDKTLTRAEAAAMLYNAIF